MRIPILRPIGANEKEHFTYEMLIAALDKAKGDELEMYFDSPGGCTATANLMYNTIAERKKEYKNIVAIIAGEASSAASYLAQIADSVKAFPLSSMVIHEARYPIISGDLTVDALEKHKQDLDATNDQIAAVYAEKSKKPKDFWRDIMKQERRINAPELLELGLIDEVFETKRAVALATEVHNSTKSISMEAVEMLAKSVQGLGRLVKLALGGKAKNMAVELADGKMLFVYSEDGELEGKQAVLADAEGNPTEENAPAGTHDLRDGRKIVVGEGGVISAVEESALAQAIARAEAAEKKVAEMEAKVNEAAQAVTEATQRMEALARATTTAPASVTRTAQTTVEKDEFDPIAAVAKMKGMSREQAEKWYNSQKKTN